MTNTIDESSLPDELEETTVDDSGSGYRPEGNEAGVLEEFHYSLTPDSLTEGLSFPEDVPESTYVPPPSPERKKGFLSGLFRS